MSLTGESGKIGGIGIVRPYGDTTGDGRVQLSFTLPVPFGDEAERARAEGAALQLAAKMGLDPAMVVHAKGMGPDFTFFQSGYGAVGEVGVVTVDAHTGCIIDGTPKEEVRAAIERLSEEKQDALEAAFRRARTT